MKINKISLLIFLNIFFILFFSISFSYEIKISGNNKLSIDDLQSITSDDLFKKKFSTEEINNIVKDIYLSDIVFDYSLVFQDDVAFIEIEESSLTENIFINNNSFIEDDVIISQLKSKESTFLNKEFIKSDIDRIRKLYSFK